MAHNGTLVNADVIRELLEDGWTCVPYINRFRSYSKPYS